ncbi:hypothetical protein BV25DRAFT_1995593 [Artomyces pyxidatus]|uniref:Uncharacterized protein n=1 Tax=Artomyces pyxidatus TaxID=48021 RepID=A0ACB8SJJ2_9AGAM|nr:hypothetical protein BV25DRAFT_1995593 [Artomyces pyxidatus]
MSQSFKQFVAGWLPSSTVATPAFPQRTTAALATQTHASFNDVRAFLDGQDLRMKVDKFLFENPDITQDTLRIVSECLAPCGKAPLPFNIDPDVGAYGATRATSQVFAPAQVRYQPGNNGLGDAVPFAASSTPAVEAYGAMPAAYLEQTSLGHPMAAQLPVRASAIIDNNNTSAIEAYGATPAAYPQQTPWGHPMAAHFPVRAPAPIASNNAPAVNAYGAMPTGYPQQTFWGHPTTAQVSVPAPAPVFINNALTSAAYGAMPTAYPQQTPWGQPMAPQGFAPAQALHHTGNQQVAPAVDYFSVPSPTSDRSTPSLVFSWSPSTTMDSPLPPTPTDTRVPANPIFAQHVKRWVPPQTPAHHGRLEAAAGDVHMVDASAMAPAPSKGGSRKRKAEKEVDVVGAKAPRVKRPRPEGRKTRAKAVAGPSQGTGSQETVEALHGNTVKVQNGDRGGTVVAVNIIPEVLTVSQPGPSALRKTGSTLGMKPTGQGKGKSGGGGVKKATSAGRGRGKAAILGARPKPLVTRPKKKGLKFACPLCLRLINRIADVGRHLNTHRKKEIYCERCGSKVSRKDALLRHKRTPKCARLEKAKLASEGTGEIRVRDAEVGSCGY